MTTGIKFDTKEFNKALDQYSVWTSRDNATIANGKARDLMFMAAKFAPKGRASDIRAVVTSPRFISWYCNEVFGVGQWTQDDREQITAILKRRITSTLYMKNAFAKAGLKFPQPEPSRPGRKPPKPQGARKRFQGTRAVVRLAKKRHQSVADFACSWQAKGSRDQRGKQVIVDRAINRAFRFVLADMKKYMERKMKQNGRKISA